MGLGQTTGLAFAIQLDVLCDRIEGRGSDEGFAYEGNVT